MRVLKKSAKRKIFFQLNRVLLQELLTDKKNLL